jgi:hypothetical protein
MKSPFSLGYKATFSFRTIQLKQLLNISFANASRIEAAYTGVRGPLERAVTLTVNPCSILSGSIPSISHTSVYGLSRLILQGSDPST